MTGWRPSSGPRAAKTRATMLARIRDYFQGEGVLEVDTPVLSHAAISDTQIESFGIAQSAISRAPLYLHTSPEFCMKRLLAAGYPDIFAICRVFRDGEAGRRHQPEFTMIEWYRLGFSLAEIVADTVAVIAAALGDRAPRFEPVVIDYREAFHRVLGIDPMEAPAERLASLTGLQAGDNQARRMLQDIKSFHADQQAAGDGDRPVPFNVSAVRWLDQVFEPTMARVPPHLFERLEPAELFHHLLDHRYYMGERLGRPVRLAEALDDYIEQLAAAPEERLLLTEPSAVGDPTGEIPLGPL